jgi:hypothetical protein
VYIYMDRVCSSRGCAKIQLRASHMHSFIIAEEQCISMCLIEMAEFNQQSLVVWLAGSWRRVIEWLYADLLRHFA